MSTQIGREELLRPINNTSQSYFILLGLALVAVLFWVSMWSLQLARGLIVTGLGDWGSGGGVTWGLYIGSFIWWVGIAHGGIILSAAVRLFGMDKYQPVARMAELLTLAALMMAGLLILVHLGRPDRVVTSIVPVYFERVHNSPLVWDVTVITLYFVLTATYILLTLRFDIHRLRDQLPDRYDPIYETLLLGYSTKEDQAIERMVWWLALGIIVLAPLLLHGGVIPWLFALMSSMPGWFGGIQGPTFLSIALSSAVAGLIIITNVFRRLYGWEEIFTDDVIRGLTLWLGLFVLFFLWLQLQQIITGVFHPSVGVGEAAHGKVTSTVYWTAIGTVVLAQMYIFAQAVNPDVFRRRRSIVASVLVLGGTLTEKTYFVIEGLLHPEFSLYAAVPGNYSPSVVELSVILGTVAMVTMFFMIVAKIVPVVELHAIEDHSGHNAEEAGE